ncbi:GNAT family N-acetyltransferase [Altererythrobacter xixiisoli]|uniref:GNAT family N-acetyltransferase n=1 Tax=Croceibacterium xixiisoli TaxID=1476466 RepID=A0A6I4TRI9_9SPHN|nr:GNAT family N-acetyltransferase [Croceibacterium xixiisoli]
MRVDRLGTGDDAQYRALNCLFADVFDDRESYLSDPPYDDYVARLLAMPHVVALIARDDAGTLIGGLVGYELPKLEQRRSEFYIYDLAVVENHRRRGVATALIEAMRAVARAAGGWAVFVQGDYGDDAALALYDKLGEREAVLHFDIAP